MRVPIVEDEPCLAEAIRGGLRLEAIAAHIATVLLPTAPPPALGSPPLLRRNAAFDRRSAA